MSEDIGVTRFREYLRVNTEQPKPDYGKKLKNYISTSKQNLNRGLPGFPFQVCRRVGNRKTICRGEHYSLNILFRKETVIGKLNSRLILLKL